MLSSAMAKKRTEVEAGTGSVFADLGYADARERSLKVQLAIEVNRLLEERGLAQERAAKLLGMRQPHVSDLVRYRLNRFSVERLMDFLTRLGRDVEIRIARRRSGRRRSAVQVRHVE
jgi:predicted XRE-type DNA-binding protein